MDIKITTGTMTDQGTIAQFQVEMALESEGTALNLDTVMKGVAAVIEHPERGTYYLAKVKTNETSNNTTEKTVGSLLVTKEWSDWNNCDYWWIQSVYVRPEFRNMGVFKTLYKEVRRLATEAGSTNLRLYVDKTNTRAQSTYKKLGMDECHYLMYEETLTK